MVVKGGPGSISWGLPTVVARPSASVKLLQAAPDPQERTGPGDRVPIDGRVGMLSVLSAVALLRDRQAPSVDLGVQQLCMEGKGGAHHTCP